MLDLMPWRKTKSTISNPDNSVDLFRKQANSLFDQFFEMPDWGSKLQPKVDIIEKKKKIEVKAEVPGIEVDDLDISLKGQYLTISGSKKQEKEDSTDNYYHLERSFGSFSRTVELPEPVDESNVDASYKKGVLSIKLKKTKPKIRKQVKIKTI